MIKSEDHVKKIPEIKRHFPMIPWSNNFIINIHKTSYKNERILYNRIYPKSFEVPHKYGRR